MDTRPLRIVLVAGEASGDILGADLIHQLKKYLPNAEFSGVGGPLMCALGFESLFEQERLAVRGLVEVLRRLPEILSIRRDLLRQLFDNPPDLFIGIDSPDFNLPIEKKLKKKGVKVLHYVSPSVWAWRSNRIKKIIKSTDCVLCLFPMEVELYQNQGGQAQFVGHPLARQLSLEQDKIAMRQTLKIEEDRPVFTLMPGSRVSEIQYLAKIFLQTAEQIRQTYPNALFLLPAGTAITRHMLQEMLSQKEYEHFPIRLMSGHAQMAIIASDVVLVASGTATLEVALCKCPMVISYRISPITFALVKSRFKLPFVGLPNILLNRFVVPELLQKDAHPEKLAEAVIAWLKEPEKLAELKQDFIKLHKELQATDDAVAKAVLNYLP